MINHLTRTSPYDEGGVDLFHWAEAFRLWATIERAVPGAMEPCVSAADGRPLDLNWSRELRYERELNARIGDATVQWWRRDVDDSRWEEALPHGADPPDFVLDALREIAAQGGPP